MSDWDYFNTEAAAGEDEDAEAPLFTQPPDPADEERAPPAAAAATAATEPREQEILLLLDAKNGFNMLSRLGMLWTVRHRWPQAARFVFNCYRHEARLVCRRPGQEALILFSREGVAQGDPLAMAIYGVGLLPLGEHLRAKHPLVFQPWFADDLAAMGTPEDVAACLVELQRVGPMFGYYPEPEKSWGICPLADEAAAKAAFEAMELNVNWTRGHRYVGGFVGSVAMRNRWIEPQVEQWVAAVEALAKVARRFPQSAYAGFTHCLQGQWAYVSRCVPGVSPLLAPVEGAIQQHLIPALLGSSLEEAAKTLKASEADFRRLLGNAVKNGGMAIRDPVASAERARTCSVAASGVLVESLIGGGRLDTMAHKQCARAASQAARKERIEEEQAFIEELKERWRGSANARRRLARAGETGAWLTVMPSRRYDSILSREEFQDNVRLRFGLRPLGLCDRCDGCGAAFSVEHALNCKKGGLVCTRHNDVRDEAAAICAHALSPSCVKCEPKIYFGTGVRAGQQAGQGGTAGAAGDGARGDLSAHGLWKRAETCVLDVKVMDTDAPSYQSTPDPKKVLERAARQKKTKYLKACLERRRSFMPLVYSVDGMAAKETRAFERRTASLLASKLNRRYSEMCGIVRSRMALAVVRSNTLLLRGSRLTKAATFQATDGADLSQMEHINTRD